MTDKEALKIAKDTDKCRMPADFREYIVELIKKEMRNADDGK